MTPPPSGNLDETVETVDLTHPMEGDDCFPLLGDLDEMVDWSQPARGDLGRLTSIGHTCTRIPVWDRVTWQWRGQAQLVCNAQTVLSQPTGMGQVAHS